MDHFPLQKIKLISFNMFQPIQLVGFIFWVASNPLGDSSPPVVVGLRRLWVLHPPGKVGPIKSIKRNFQKKPHKSHMYQGSGKGGEVVQWHLVGTKRNA